MPRGVYARESAHQKQAGKVAKAKATAIPPVHAPAPAAAPSAPAARIPGPAQSGPTEVARAFTRDDFRKPIDNMSGPLLRAFARSIGILQRDVDHLTEDRLRQNCKARQLEALED